MQRGVPFAGNDLSIRDGVPFQISRNHCVIEKMGNRIAVRDRGSTVGTVVNGRAIGVNCDDIVAQLKRGANELFLGAAEGPHYFTVTVEAGWRNVKQIFNRPARRCSRFRPPCR